MSPIAKATSVGPTVSGGATTVPSTTETTSHTTVPTVKRTDAPTVGTTVPGTPKPTPTVSAPPSASRTPTPTQTTTRTTGALTPSPSPTESPSLSPSPTPVNTPARTNTPEITPTSPPPTSPVSSPTPEPRTPTPDPNVTPLPAPNGTPGGWSPIVPETNETVNTTVSTPWPIDSVTTYPTPTETPDIDPGMTPYNGPSPATTPTDASPTFDPNQTPTTNLSLIAPVFTAEVVSSPPFEIPPGMLENEAVLSPTGTFEPAPSLSGPDDPGEGSSFLPRWIMYVLFVFLGITGVASLAIVGTFLGGRDSGTGPRRGSAAVVSVPSGTARQVPPLLAKDSGELPLDQQILVDRIAGFSPGTMPIERLARNLLRFERAVQERTGDPSLRLGRLLRLSSLPSLDIPSEASAWAHVHGFRVLSVDGSGMALVMAVLPSVGHSELGVLPVASMQEGTSPVPMPVLPPVDEPESGTPSPFLSGLGHFGPVDTSE